MLANVYRLYLTVMLKLPVIHVQYKYHKWIGERLEK